MNRLALSYAIDWRVALRGVGEHLRGPGRPDAGVRLDCPGDLRPRVLQVPVLGLRAGPLAQVQREGGLRRPGAG